MPAAFRTAAGDVVVRLGVPQLDTYLAGIGADSVLSDRNLLIADAVNEIAGARGSVATQIAIAWLRAQHPRGVVIPILGARTRAQIDDNLNALDVELSADELHRLDMVSRIELGFPYDFGAARLAYGQIFELIDDHRGLIKPARVNPFPRSTAVPATITPHIVVRDAAASGTSVRWAPRSAAGSPTQRQGHDR